MTDLFQPICGPFVGRLPWRRNIFSKSCWKQVKGLISNFLLLPHLKSIYTNQYWPHRHARCGRLHTNLLLRHKLRCYAHMRDGRQNFTLDYHRIFNTTTHTCYHIHSTIMHTYESLKKKYSVWVSWCMQDCVCKTKYELCPWQPQHLVYHWVCVCVCLCANKMSQRISSS